MVKINWSVRFRNPVWLTAFVSFIISTIYQILSMFNVAPAITQDVLVQAVAGIVQLLTLMGVLIDPTSKGINDTEYVLSMKSPE